MGDMNDMCHLSSGSSCAGVLEHGVSLPVIPRSAIYLEHIYLVKFLPYLKYSYPKQV